MKKHPEVITVEWLEKQKADAEPCVEGLVDFKRLFPQGTRLTVAAMKLFRGSTEALHPIDWLAWQLFDEKEQDAFYALQHDGGDTVNAFWTTYTATKKKAARGKANATP